MFLMKKIKMKKMIMKIKRKEILIIVSKIPPELRNYMNTIPHLMKKISKKNFFWKNFLPHGKLEVGKGTCLARGGGRRLVLTVPNRGKFILRSSSP